MPVPTVVSTAPTDGQTKIPLNQVISVNFSQNMDGTTITAATFLFQVYGAGGWLAGTVAGSGLDWGLTPDDPLEYDTIYSVFLDNAIKDADGHNLAAPYQWTFQTAGVATVTTQAASDVAERTATGNGNITDNGGLDITERGICYSTSPDPMTTDSKVSDNTNATGAFTMSLTDLVPGKKYYAKAYCINAAGTSYGAEINFTTKAVPKIITIMPVRFGL